MDAIDFLEHFPRQTSKPLQNHLQRSLLRKYLSGGPAQAAPIFENNRVLHEEPAIFMA
jgi:hypothetical protein